MDTKGNDFLNQLLATFRIEAEEHHKAIVAGLLELEKASTPEEQAPLLDTTFRDARSLKGAAHAVNQTDIEAVCQSMEGVFARLKGGELLLSPSMLDTLHQALDTVEVLLTDPEGRHAVRVAEAVDELTLLEEQTGELPPDGEGQQPGVLAPPPIEVPASVPVSAVPEEMPAPDPARAEAPGQAETPAISQQPASPMPASEFLDKLRAAFYVEADEHLKAMVAGLLDLEKAPTQQEQTPLLEKIFRNAHSLKGAARTVNLTDIETISKALEDVFVRLKHQGLPLAPTGFDTLRRTLDTIAVLLTAPAGTQTARVAEAVDALYRLEQDSERPTGVLVDIAVKQQPVIAPMPTNGAVSMPLATNGSDYPVDSSSQPPAPPRPKAAFTQARATTAETIRISTAKLDSLLMQGEELLAVKQAAGERLIELRNLLFMLSQWKRKWAKTSPNAHGVQRIFEASSEHERCEQPYLPLAARLVEFLHWSEHELGIFETKLRGMTRAADRDHQEAGIMVTNLLEETKKLMLLPFLSRLDVFPKRVRDLSRSLGKEVDLSMRGTEVEIDKRILEALQDPLIHLIRNGVDHGIENPEARLQQGKSQRGSLTIEISQVSANMVEVLIADDGAGIDPDAVKKVAVQRGVISAQEAAPLSTYEAIDLIFQSGVSTSPSVTDLSGRGLGMAIVREKVETLGGQISIETTPGKGTAFRLLLPLTLATFRGIFVQAAGQTFVIPTANVNRVVRIRFDEVKTVEDRETIVLQGRPVPLTHLDTILGLPHREKRDEQARYMPALVLGSAEKRRLFCVDRILNEQEVPFKSLGSYLTAVRHVAGVTLTGSGTVVPILNAADLLQSAVEGTFTPAGAATVVAQEETRLQSVLVAEDSVTSRMMLKGILESAGYQVTTAIDGLDAFGILKRGQFDLVVSDVAMPRMNGFELTSKIREDGQYGQVPVVLVTGLESDADRERGINAGASAYIVKGSFDHSNLLETIRRLA